MIENITICKQTYLNFYNQISQYLTNTIRNLPVDETNEIDRDLQRHNCFINLAEKNDFSDHNIIDTFCNFFSTTWKISRFSRFDRSSKTRNTIFYKT